MNFIKKAIAPIAMILSLNCYSETYGELIPPEDYHKPDKSFREWSKIDKSVNEAYHVQAGSITCGSIKGAVIAKNHRFAPKPPKFFVKNNCSFRKKSSYARVIKSVNDFSFIEFSFLKHDSHGNLVSYFGWIHNDKLVSYKTFIGLRK